MTSNGAGRSNIHISNVPWYTWRIHFHGTTLLAEGRNESEAIKEAIYIRKKYQGINQIPRDVISVEKNKLLIKGVDYVE